MSTIDLPTGFLHAHDVWRISLSFLSLSIAYVFASAIYNAFFSPLSKFPGPKLWSISKIPRTLVMVSGNEGQGYADLHHKYGPIVRTGPRELSFAGGSQAFKDIYGFKKHGKPAPYKDPMFYGASLNNAPSVILADDAGHSRQRKILSHAFSDKALKEQEPLLKRWSQLLRTKLSERTDGHSGTDMVKFYNCTTFDIMGDLTFSEGLDMLHGGEYNPWVKTIFASIKNGTMFRSLRGQNAFLKYIMDNVVFRSKAVRKMAWEHNKYTVDRVDRRLKLEPEHEDLWAKILAKDSEDGGLSLEEHYSNASLFMIAGTETTATALSGTTYHLLRNPDCMEKLTKEIRGAFDDFDDVTLEGLARLRSVLATTETGRAQAKSISNTSCFPANTVVALPRVTPKEGAIVCDQHIPGDVSIGVNHFATYRQADHFKNAYEFHPERWLGDPEYKDDDLDALEVHPSP
ncbi:hypothetical protein LTR37_006538 [Vermiconidia calcicola]|uniref:Uncharacterized protein n=1 Tax=Vermiconidia calcicola TaxID=1690605 RepID=A0ACC3NGM4_9PEZI|nr:hypothetical protein LTR37_006538 [Vermiconidia calcicola]